MRLSTPNQNPRLRRWLGGGGLDARLISMIRVSGLDHNAYIKSARIVQDDLLANGLQVEGSVPGNLEVIVSSDVAQLEGSVIDEDGAVIEAEVRLAPDPWTPYNRLRVHHTTTDQLGHFSFTDVPPENTS